MNQSKNIILMNFSRSLKFLLDYMVVFFTRNTCTSKTLEHKAVIIPPIYITGTHRFPLVSISSCTCIFFGARCIFENVKNLLGEVKICFLAITYFYYRLSYPYFAYRVGLKYFIYNVTHSSCCLPVFEKTQM